jgi:cold shock CspA family protein
MQHTSLIRGTVYSFNPRRGTGFVRHSTGADRIPFSARDSREEAYRAGEPVEFTVVGGKAGVIAREVRSVA